MATQFDTTPEKRATQLAFMKRQLFRKTRPVTRQEVDLTGQTAIVTGSNTGIGLECSRQLLDLGVSKLILAVRSVAKGEAAKKELAAGRSADKQTIEVWRLDLLDYDSVVEFAERTKTLDRMDIVIQNAGIVNATLKINPKTRQEEVLQTNYLSLVLLVALLLPIMREKNTPESPGRLSVVSSEVASWAPFKERHAEPMLPAFIPAKPEDFFGPHRYWTSKLLCLFFLSELTKRVPPTVAIINFPNPGLIKGTNFMDDWNGSVMGFVMGIGVRMLGRTPTQGATALTDSVVRHGVEAHGQYLEDGKPQPLPPMLYSSEADEIGRRLWEETMAELAFAKVAETIQQVTA